MISLMCVGLIWLLKCYWQLFRSFMRPRREANTITHNPEIAAPSTAMSVWDRLPVGVADYIFGKLRTVDRVRMMSVSKLWRYTLMQDHIPVAEPPWRIIPQDSYSKPEYSLYEICFSTFDGKNYLFKLPLPGRWWCCGSSRGWLLMAGCDWDENLEEDVDIILWNPISGAIRKLPALSTIRAPGGNLSTITLFSDFLHDVLPKGIESVSPFIEKVHVFSVESAEWVVAIICNYPTDYRNTCLALCTPQDQSWSVVDKEALNMFTDICFHNGKLYVCCEKLNNLEANETIKREANYKISLKECDVEVKVLSLIYEGGFKEEIFDLPDFYYLDKHERYQVVEHLVPEIMSGELLAVSAIRDLWFYLEEDPIKSLMYCQTSKFEVRRLVERSGSLEKLDGIGEQAIFLGSKSSVSLAHGIEAANCIYFATDDATGIFSDPLNDTHIFDPSDLDKLYWFREEGVFDLRQKLIEETFLTTLRIQSGSTTGWFTPKFSR